ncbi:hypothetical protein LG201_13255 [Methylobacillus gramineus]|uniref:LGFP repeat-containing protein n=1 Tax=Methylobacillus gramineus TaxID=755169 RepID=UPI001D0007E0|nr:hypothetical protein [Methylobacillus gramineus]MCB5186176.1 hypothetical protein [Methylobacillus gramineus]
MAKIELDVNELGSRLGGWRVKDGTAAEYKSAGSHYLTYAPMISSPIGGGLQLMASIDHIISIEKTDHCQLHMHFDASGILVSWKVELSIQGASKFDSGWVLEAAGTGMFGREYAATAAVAIKVLNTVSGVVAGLATHGGRAVFPSVIQMNFNHIIGCMRREFLVYGEIASKYAALGGEHGFLGRPLTDETGTSGQVGRCHHFESGSIYWTTKTGAWAVHGPIRDKWASLGWERSVLGYPIADEQQRPEGGRFSRFQHGDIHWTQVRGAWIELSKVGQVKNRLKDAAALSITNPAIAGLARNLG